MGPAPGYVLLTKQSTPLPISPTQQTTTVRFRSFLLKAPFACMHSGIQSSISQTSICWYLRRHPRPAHKSGMHRQMASAEVCGLYTQSIGSHLMLHPMDGFMGACTLRCASTSSSAARRSSPASFQTQINSRATHRVDFSMIRNHICAP